MFDLNAFSGAITALAKSAAGSVVAVHGHRASASGFVWKPGWVVAAEEAMPRQGPVTVHMHGGTKRSADIVGRDASTGLALLKLDAEAGVPAKLGAAPEMGGLALVLGEDRIAHGLVAHLGEAWTSMRGGEIDARIELDIRLQRQLEGGLALGADGTAFGMVLSGPRRRALVIPSATIERVLPQLQEKGRIARGYLGLNLQRVRVAGQEQMGSMVVGLDPQGPGAAAGVHQGDVLVSWNGTPAEEAGRLSRALGPQSVGSVVDLGIRRAGELRNMKITVGERPAA